MPLSLIPIPSLAYFPFETEDAETVGRTFGFEIENNLTYFRYYDGTYQQDYEFEIAVGLRENLDLALFVPYSKIYDGSEQEGLNDVGFYIKHIPYQKRLRLGYLFQVNLDTGKEGIGYSKTTANINLIGETTLGETTYGVNLLYIKSGHIKGLRDSYGATLGVFREYRDVLSYGIELKVLTPEDENVDTPDTHALLGAVYHWKNVDIAFGFHKALTKHSSFADYAFYSGVKFAF